MGRSQRQRYKPGTFFTGIHSKLTDVIDINFRQKFQDDSAEGVGLLSVTVVFG